MKNLLFLLISFFTIACSKDDNNDIQSRGCLVSNYSWSRSNDSISNGSGGYNYRVDTRFDIKNETNEIKLCDCLAISNPDNNGTRYTAIPETPIIVEPNEPLIGISVISENYFSSDIIELGVEYIETNELQP